MWRLFTYSIVLLFVYVSSLSAQASWAKPPQEIRTSLVFFPFYEANTYDCISNCDELLHELDFLMLGLNVEYLESFTAEDILYWGVNLELLPTFGRGVGGVMIGYNLHYKANLLGLFNRNYLFWDWSAGVGTNYLSYKRNNEIKGEFGLHSRFSLTFNMRIAEGVFIETSALVVFPLVADIYYVTAHQGTWLFKIPLAVRWRI